MGPACSIQQIATYLASGHHPAHVSLLAANVDHARELLGTELSALVGESYDRAYGDMVRVQQLTELEEVIRYSQLHNDCECRSVHTDTSEILVSLSAQTEPGKVLTAACTAT